MTLSAHVLPDARERDVGSETKCVSDMMRGETGFLVVIPRERVTANKMHTVKWIQAGAAGNKKSIHTFAVP